MSWPEDDIDPISFASDRCDICGIDPDEVRAELLEKVLKIVDEERPSCSVVETIYERIKALSPAPPEETP